MFCNNLFQKEWNDDSVSFPILHAMLWLVLCDSHYSWDSVNSHLLTPDRELVILPQIVPKFNLVSQCVSFGSLVEIWAVYRSRDDSRTSHQRPVWAAAPESWDSGAHCTAGSSAGGRVSFPESADGLIPFQAAWLISAASRLPEKTWVLAPPYTQKEVKLVPLGLQAKSQSLRITLIESSAS